MCGTSKKILIAEDDTVLLKLYRKILEEDCYRLTCTEDGHEAARILEERKFDLLIADLILPRMDGLELISRARIAQPELSVLVVTSLGSDEFPQFMEEEYGLQADRWLKKPIELRKFFNAVEDLLQGTQKPRKPGESGFS